jgi:hypothetical protein
VKTAVSIPDPLFEAAERLARRTHVSRSRLYARALELLLATTDDDDVTAALDDVYATEPSSLDPHTAAAQARAVDEAW